MRRRALPTRASLPKATRSSEWFSTRSVISRDRRSSVGTSVKRRAVLRMVRSILDAPSSGVIAGVVGAVLPPWAPPVRRRRPGGRGAEAPRTPSPQADDHVPRGGDELGERLRVVRPEERLDEL